MNNISFASKQFKPALICLLIISFFASCNNNEKRDGINIVATNNNTIFENSNIHNTFELCQNSLPLDLKLVGQNSDSLALSHILNKDSIYLVLFISDLFCTDCVINELSNLSVLQSTLGFPRILIFGRYNSFRKPWLILESKQIKNKLYQLPLSSIDNLFNQIHQPCYLLIYKNHLLINCYLPNKERNDITLKYFKMCEYYLNKMNYEKK